MAQVKIEQFEIPGLAQYRYIVSSEGKAAVVDPIRDIDRYPLGRLAARSGKAHCADRRPWR
jgi:hypothetical protein